MCTVSMVIDHYTDKWRDVPGVAPYVSPPAWPVPVPVISREEFDQLRRDLDELKKLVERAKKYDEDTGQKDCELDEKVALVKRMADLVGVSVEDVFKRSTK